MIRRWDIITIGNLSRNLYWGEEDDEARRSAICTCTLLTGDGFRLLVDPSLSDPASMVTELDRRTGMTPDQITHVFITHEHGDHHVGMIHFPEARWLAAAPVVDKLNGLTEYGGKVKPAEGRIPDSVRMLPTPGHTMTHHSLEFECEGATTIVTGDAVMTRDFWRDRRGYFNSVDFDLVKATMEWLATRADVLIPGHGNWFPNDAAHLR